MDAQDAGGAPDPAPVSDRVRALLSRAAEEQLHEQRQVSAVLGELRAMLGDVDERTATGEQVERVAAEVRQLSARLDAAETRSDELAQRIADATALLGQAAQDLVEAVVAGVAERLEAQLGAATASVTGSVAELVEHSERRLGTRVDDAVLALAGVVLRRPRPARSAPPEPVADPPTAAPPEPEPEPALEATPAADAAEAPADDPSPAASEVEPTVPEEQQTDEPDHDAQPDQDAQPDHDVQPDHDAQPDHDLEPPVTVDLVAAAAGPAPVDPFPGDGFVLVPADVEDADPQPGPVVQVERRTADRRDEPRSDGSGRRRRPWWRQV